MKIKNNISEYYENGKPVHRISYCAFLDVLGFSERVLSSYKSGNGNKLLQEFNAILTRSVNKFRDKTQHSMIYSLTFTDNTVLAHPRYSDDMEAEFGAILDAILHYQFQMAIRGFFVRGGLSVGQLYVDNNSVYGAALLEAYRLESSVAVNPVVVLCNDTMQLVDLHITYYGGEIAPQLRHVLKGPDGRYFLNYLSECILEEDFGYELDTDALLQHKNQIVNALTLYAHIPKVFAKFSWLAVYHNFFCDFLHDFPAYDITLKIDEKKYNVKFTTIKPMPKKSASKEKQST